MAVIKKKKKRGGDGEKRFARKTNGFNVMRIKQPEALEVYLKYYAAGLIKSRFDRRRTIN